MTLQNFKLQEPTGAIALEGLGHYWDLHAYAELIEVKYLTVENIVEFRWVVPNVGNPWGDKDNHAKGCILRFSDVSLLRMAQPELRNTNEDDCIAGISQVSTKPAADSHSIELRTKAEWKADEDFGLLFELQSGRTIEIHADCAELIAL